MLSKTITKRITSLHLKKFRQQEQLFIAEGIKVVSELLAAGYFAEYLFTTAGTKQQFSVATLIDEAEMKRISALADASPVLAVFRIPKATNFKLDEITVVADGIRDPGNFGALIRLCDWFGVSQLLCAPDTVDLYNPKVVQASMGSMARVRVTYQDISNTIRTQPAPVYGAFMEGESVYNQVLETPCYLILGNEANGIRSETEESITKKISIPRYGKLQQTESLNVTTAAAIILAEMRRNTSGR